MDKILDRLNHSWGFSMNNIIIIVNIDIVIVSELDNVIFFSDKFKFSIEWLEFPVTIVVFIVIFSIWGFSI